MNWVLLYAAGVVEVIGVILIKRTADTKRYRFWVGLGMAAMMAVSLYLLSLSLRSIPTGTAYAIWTGIGSVGSVLAGIFLFGETYHARKLFYLTVILVGIIGLNLV